VNGDAHQCRPVSRDEIRFNGARITTLPVDSVKVPRRGYPHAIERLWQPLLDALNREQQERWAADQELRKKLAGSGWRGGVKRPNPIRCPHPSWTPLPCEHCGREFYRVLRIGRFCCDRCAQAAHSAATARAKSEARAAARAGRTCVVCGEPIEGQRSTRRYHSDACRVRAYRERKEAKAEGRT
jgi:hypothetical protein